MTFDIFTFERATSEEPFSYNCTPFTRHCSILTTKFSYERMSSSLRQRQWQREIVQIEARENRQKIRIGTVQGNASNMMGKLYAIILFSLALFVFVVVSALRPKLLPWNREPVPKQVIAFMYPENVSPRRDLVPFVGNLAVCTPENLAAREAIRYVVHQREILKSRAVKVVFYPLELDQLSVSPFCGEMDGFPEMLLESPHFFRRDLYLWCLLKESRIQGFLEYGVYFQKPLRAYKNMAIRNLGGEQQILSSFFVSASDSTVPSKMLEWLLLHGGLFWDESEYRQRMEQRLFQIIHDDNETWTLLDAVCGDCDHGNFTTRMWALRLLSRRCWAILGQLNLSFVISFAFDSIFLLTSENWLHSVAMMTENAGTFLSNTTT